MAAEDSLFAAPQGGAGLDRAGAAGPATAPAPAPAPSPAPAAAPALDAAPAPAAATAPAGEKTDWTAVIQQLQEDKRLGLRRTMYGALSRDPDTEAKALGLSRQTGVPADVAVRNMGMVEREARLSSFDYARLLKESPRTADWLAQPDQAALAHDDVPGLLAHEQVVKEHGYASQLLNAFAAKGAWAAQVPVQFADALGTAVYLPYNIPAYLMGKQQIRTNYANNAFNRYMRGSESGLLAQAPELRSVVTAYQEGGTGAAVRAAGLMLAHESSFILMTMLSGGAAAGMRGTAGAAQLSATQQASAAAMRRTLGSSGTMMGGVASARLQELNEAGVDPLHALPNALVHGAGEMLEYEAGLIGPLRALGARLAAQVGKPAAKALIRDGLVWGAATLGGSAASGASTELFNSWANAAMGDEFAWDDLLPRMAEEGFNEAIVGVGFGGGAAALQLSGAAARAARDQAATAAFGAAVQGSKLAGRDLLSYQGYVKNVTEGTPLETAYIQPEALDTYFQGQNTDAAYAVEALGPDVAKAYAQAKETRTLMQAPTSLLIPALAKAGHLDALQGDIVYAPENLSAKQVQALGERMQAEATQAQDAWQQSLSAVTAAHQAQLEATGDTPDVAQARAATYAAWVSAQAARMRMIPGYEAETPESFASRYALKVEASEMSSKDRDALERVNQMEAMDAVAQTGGLTPLGRFVRQNGRLAPESLGGELTDDRSGLVAKAGKGLSPDRMLERAVEAGLLPPEATPADLFRLLDAEATRKMQLESRLGQSAVRRASRRFEQAAAQGPEAYQPVAREDGESAGNYLERRWEAMSQDERLAAFMRDSKTGMLSQRAWRLRLDEAGKPLDGRLVADVALEGGKYINDTYGHAAGDAWFRVLGQALKDAGVEAYKNDGRISFLAEGPQQFDQVMQRVRESLPEWVTLTDAQGRKHTVNARELELTGALAETDAQADVVHKAAREEREAAGTRAERGKKPMALRVSEEAGTEPGSVEAASPADLGEKFDGLSDSLERVAVERDNKGRPTGFLTADGRALLPERPFQAHADLAHMGLVNRLYGHAAGDKLLRAAKESMLFVRRDPRFDGKLDLTHDSGDEFSTQADSAEIQQEYWAAVEQDLRQQSIEITDDQGVQWIQEGAYISVGIGGDHGTAEQRLKEGKERLGDVRSEAGLRALVRLASERQDRGALSARRGSEQADSAAGPLRRRDLSGIVGVGGALDSRAGGVAAPSPGRAADEGEAGGLGGSYENAVKQAGTLSVEDGGATQEEGAPYQRDLFGDAEPAAIEHGAEPDQVRLKENAKPFVESKLKIAAGPITTPEAAAQAFSHLAKKSSEHVQALVLDSKGVPLAFVAHTIGTTDTSQVSPQVLLGESLSVPGAAQVWLGHNHPSGSGTLSHLDEGLSRRVEDLFNGTNVEFKGFLAIGAKKADGTQKFGFRDGRVSNNDLDVPAPSGSTATVPVLSRELDPVGAFGGKIRTSGQAREVAQELSGGRPGVVLLTSQAEPVAFIPVTPADAGKIRGSGRMEAIFKAFASSNGARALVYSGDKAYSETEALNLTAFLQAANMNVLDVIGDHESWTESGRAIRTSISFYQDSKGGKKDPRAEISFMQGLGEERLQALMTKLPGADLSSYTHEFGHFALEVMRDMATLEGAPQVLKDDLASLEKYAEVKDGKWERENHERVARALEKYTLEGKAPADELVGTFARLRAWMLHVYWRAKLSDVELSDEVRGVFDRLFASDEQLAAAGEQAGYDPVPGIADPRYQKAIAEAEDWAKAEMQERAMRAQRRERRRLWREQRAAVERSVAEALNEDKAQRARSILERGTLPDGSQAPGVGPEGFKMDAAAFGERFGPELAARFEAMLAPAGAPLDVAAQMLGFGGPDALVRELSALRPYKAELKARTDELMLLSHGSPDLDYSDASLPESAMRSVHNERRGQMLRMELEHLAKNALPALKGMMREIGGPVPRMEALRERADAVVQDLRVRELQPGLYQRAENAARREAVELLTKGDFAGAYRAKLREALNHELYRAAFDAREQVDRIVGYLKRFEKRAARERLGKAGEGYLQQVESLLERYDLRQSVSLEEIGRRKSLVAWADEMKAQGTPLDLDPRLLEQARRQSYKDTAYGELLGLRDAVKQIDHLAGLKNRLLKEGRFRDLQAAVGAAVESIVANSRGPRPRQMETYLPQEEGKRWVAGHFASHRKMASLLRQMDGHQDGGILWELLSKPLNDATNAETTMNGEAGEALGRIMDEYKKASGLKNLYKKEFIPGYGESLTKQGQLVMAMHMGNADNAAKLMLGRNLSREQVQAVLDHLSVADIKFVNDMVQLLESYWPETKALAERVNGIAPPKVEATPVQAKNGLLLGGYFPLRYDDRSNGRANFLTAEEAAKQAMSGATVRATTRHGHREARVEGVNMPVRLDLGVAFEHISGVIHDLTHYEALVDANRLLGDEDLRQTIVDHYGDLVYRQLTDTLQAVAAGQRPAQNYTERWFNYIRQGSTVASLGFNLMTSLLQPLGLAQSAQRVGVKYVARGVIGFLGDPKGMSDKIAWVYENSEFMRNRGGTLNREINEIKNQIKETDWLPVDLSGGLADKAWGLANLPRQAVPQAVKDSYFILIEKAQLLADLPTWLGAYEKAMDGAMPEGLTMREQHERAVALADQAVIDTQGSGQTLHLAEIQRGGPMMKLWTNFYSYYNLQFNLASESWDKNSRRGLAGTPEMARDFLLLFAIPAAAYVAMRYVFGKIGDEDELSQEFLAELGGSMLGLLVGVREFAAAFSGFMGYAGPAGTRLFSDAGRLAQQVKQGELDAGLASAVNRVSGVLFHYPSVQLERMVKGMMAVADGEAGPQAVLVGPPVSGR